MLSKERILKITIHSNNAYILSLIVTVRSEVKNYEYFLKSNKIFHKFIQP